MISARRGSYLAALSGSMKPWALLSGRWILRTAPFLKSPGGVRSWNLAFLLNFGEGALGPSWSAMQKAVQTENRYVCAYGLAEAFWKTCGYGDSGEIAENGMKIYVK